MRGPVISRWSLLLAISVPVGAGCQQRTAVTLPKSPPPARVEGPVKEADLTRIVLTPQAEQRLGIQTAQAERKPVRRIRTLGGDLIVPPGRDLKIAAPIGGTLLAVDVALAPGLRVRKGDLLLKLSPVLAGEREVLSPSDRLALVRAHADLADLRVEAEGRVASARVQLETARLRVERAEVLRKDNAGSLKAYEEANAELKLAETNLQAAQSRLDVLKNTSLEARPDAAAALAIESPQEGIIRAVHALPGQEVAAGAALLELVATEPLWVRVPVYVGELAALDPSGPVALTGLSAPPGAPSRPLKAILPAPSADPLSATVDLYFEVQNGDSELVPGQRMAVLLPMREPAESLVVPWSAVVFDIHGGAWVYEQAGPQSYVRRRIEVRDVIGDQAVLARGPALGTRVVSAGTAELFGTEFGVGK